MFVCHPAAKIPCQLGGSSMGLNFCLCMPTGWLNLSSLSLNKGKSWWFEQMFCKLGAGSRCSRGVVWSLNQALSFAPGASCLCPLILCPARSFSKGQRSQIANWGTFRAGKAGSSCLIVSSSVLLSAETAAELWGWQWEEVSQCWRQQQRGARAGDVWDWNCRVPGQGMIGKGFGWEEWESQPARLVVVAGMAHSPEKFLNLCKTSLIQRNGSDLAASFSEHTQLKWCSPLAWTLKLV